LGLFWGVFGLFGVGLDSWPHSAVHQRPSKSCRFCSKWSQKASQNRVFSPKTLQEPKIGVFGVFHPTRFNLIFGDFSNHGLGYGLLGHFGHFGQLSGACAWGGFGLFRSVGFGGVLEVCFSVCFG